MPMNTCAFKVEFLGRYLLRRMQYRGHVNNPDFWYINGPKGMLQVFPHVHRGEALERAVVHQHPYVVYVLVRPQSRLVHMAAARKAQSPSQNTTVRKHNPCPVPYMRQDTQGVDKLGHHPILTERPRSARSLNCGIVVTWKQQNKCRFFFQRALTHIA